MALASDAGPPKPFTAETPIGFARLGRCGASFVDVGASAEKTVEAIETMTVSFTIHHHLELNGLPSGNSRKTRTNPPPTRPPIQPFTHANHRDQP